ncbi:siderophore-interacting protein [Amycolatopsis ultiminotia]|uniref:Siderophore-interacting protein n=1 Tax=Amycolatopsis ultiminotia TaxID=543629 RepID=A0ABP6V0F5_9PSEU
MSRADHRHRHLARIAEVRAGAHAETVPYPIRIRRTEVVRTEPAGSGLVRVTLGGPGTAGFESHAPDEHVKILFPDPDGTLRLPEPNGDLLRWPKPFPRTREYTVRRYDPASGELDLDIALHNGGLGADWARAVRPGETVHVAGPPSGLIVPRGYDRYLVAGDLSAVPAVARWLEELPRTAVGWAFAEVADASEEIELAAPDGFEVHWLHRGAAAPGTSGLLARAVQEIRVRQGERLYAWIAGEAGEIKPLRRWLRSDLGLAREDFDVTGYWKRGVADFEDEHDHEH